MELARILLKAGAEINPKVGRSPLIEAVKFKRINLCKKLIEMGADVNALDKFLESPLFYAAYLNIHEIIPLLISEGANINYATTYGMTPVHAAAFAE